MPNETLIKQTIRNYHEQLKTDTAAVSALKALEATKFGTHLHASTEAFADYLNFLHYTRAMQQLKTSRGCLGERTEETIRVRYDHAVASYGAMVQAAHEMAGIFQETGVDDVLRRHKKALFWNLPSQPFADRLKDTFMAMGATEAEIQDFVHYLRVNRWDPFRQLGEGAGFGNLAIHARENLDSLRRACEAVKIHGLPTLTGGCDNDEEETLALAVGTAVIICAAVSFFGLWECWIVLAV